MAQELEGSRNIIVQEPEWFKNNHGSRTMMAQEPYTVAQNNDGSLFSKLQAISKMAQETSRFKEQSGSRNVMAQKQ